MNRQILYLLPLTALITSQTSCVAPQAPASSTAPALATPAATTETAMAPTAPTKADIEAKIYAEIKDLNQQVMAIKPRPYPYFTPAQCAAIHQANEDYEQCLIYTRATYWTGKRWDEINKGLRNACQEGHAAKILLVIDDFESRTRLLELYRKQCTLCEAAAEAHGSRLPGALGRYRVARRKADCLATLVDPTWQDAQAQFNGGVARIEEIIGDYSKCLENYGPLPQKNYEGYQGAMTTCQEHFVKDLEQYNQANQK